MPVGGLVRCNAILEQRVAGKFSSSLLGRAAAARMGYICGYGLRGAVHVSNEEDEFLP